MSGSEGLWRRLAMFEVIEVMSSPCPHPEHHLSSAVPVEFPHQHVLAFSNSMEGINTGAQAVLALFLQNEKDDASIPVQIDGELPFTEKIKES